MKKKGVEESKSKYAVNTDLIDSYLHDEFEVQDISSFREQAAARLLAKENKPKSAMLPAQGMATPAELKREIAKAKGNPSLQLSLMDSLIAKSNNDEKAALLEEKIEILLQNNRLKEAEADSKTLVSIKDSSRNRLTYSKVLIQLKDSQSAMAEFFRASVLADEDIEINEHFVHILALLQKANLPNCLFTAGSNINFTLGDGTQNTCEKPKPIIELKGKIPIKAACGDFHTILIVSGCPHIARHENCPNNITNCNGGNDVLAWGDNSYGQVLSIPTHSPVKRPTGLACFVGKNVKDVSASKRMSAAILGDDSVVLWGDLPEIEENLIEFRTNAKLIATGGEFLVIGRDDGCFLWGEINDHGSVAVSSFNQQDKIYLQPIGQITVKQISAGEYHAIALSEDSRVFSIGCGEVGQLGLGLTTTTVSELTHVWLPGPAKEIAAAGQISLALTNSNIYVWGLINPDELEHQSPIEWLPISLEGHDEEEIAAIGMGTHDLVAVDTHGRFYVWDWTFSRRLRRPPDEYKLLANIRKLYGGRSMHHFLQGVLIPQFTKVINCPSRVPSELPFLLELQLYDQIGEVLPQTPLIHIVFTTENVEGRRSKPTDVSALEFQMEILENEPTTTIQIVPLRYGDYWMHILVNNIEIINSPVPISIHPSEEQEEAKREEEEKRQRELEKENARMQKQMEAEMERKRAREMQEEINKKKKQETDRRAQDALRMFRERQAKERETKEEERRRRIEAKVGGGYDLSKLKK